jgi:hypothetical protein
MKPLLYIAVALMIGAGIYGFVDYKKKSQRKTLESLYTKEGNKEVKEPIPAPDIPEVGPAVMATTPREEAVVENKNTGEAGDKEGKKNNKRLNLKIYSRAIPTKVIIEEEDATAVDTIKATQ